MVYIKPIFYTFIFNKIFFSSNSDKGRQNAVTKIK